MPPDLARAAMFYAQQLGWAVFPLKPGDKIPLTSHGLKDASTSADQIADWWERHPTANVGVATGEASGIVVVDVDGPQGDEALASLGEMPPCPSSSTGKGRHLIFARPSAGLRNSAGKLGPQLDIRADGGYIVVPPSIHPSGARYKWLEGLDPSRIAAPALPNAVVARLTDPLAVDGSGDASARPASEIPLGCIPQGERNDTLARYAGKLLGKGHGELETLALIRGINVTQCVPPLLPDEVENVVRSIVATERRNKRQRNGDAPEHPAAIKPREGPVALSEYLKRPELLQPPPAFVPRLCYEGRVTLFSANHKAGKSTLMGQACAALTRGSEFLGESLGAPQTVLWYVLDEPLGDAVRRFAQYGADPSRLFLVEDPPTAEEMRADLELTGARVVVVDTLIELFKGVDENSASELAPLIRPYIDVSRSAGASLVFLHHTGRSGLDYRGSGHLGAAVDLIVTMQVVGAGAPGAPNVSDDPTVEDVRRILKGKGRGGIHFHERLSFDGTRYSLGSASPVQTLRSRILTLLLDMPASGNKIAKDLKVRREEVLEELRNLTVDVLVRRTADGQQYELTETGKLAALNAQEVTESGSEGGSHGEGQEAPGNHPRGMPAEGVNPSGTIAEPLGNHPGTTSPGWVVPEKTPRGLGREPPNESDGPGRLSIAL